MSVAVTRHCDAATQTEFPPLNRKRSHAEMSADAVAREALPDSEAAPRKVARYEPRPLTLDRVRAIRERANVHRYLARAIAAGGATVLNGNPAIVKEHLETKYNITPGAETDQKHSGRCWIFSSLNLMRLYVLDDYGKDFQYSQNFVAFWDKFERAHFLLEKMVEHKDLEWDDQRLQNLIEHVFTDGGEWELFENIAEKYGLVPCYAMPETQFSGNSKGYQALLLKHLREVGGFLHKKAKDAPETAATRGKLNAIIKNALTEVYRVLCNYLGEPPEKFLWKGADGKLTHLTPAEFYAQGKCDLSQKVHLTHLPHVPPGVQVQVEDVGNVVGGLPLRSLNVTMEDIKRAVRESIKKNHAVEIACEMKYLDRDCLTEELQGALADAENVHTLNPWDPFGRI